MSFVRLNFLSQFHPFRDRTVSFQTLLLFVLLLFFQSCNKVNSWEGLSGELRLRITEDSVFPTRASLELPDTNDFLLEVSGPSGEIIYSGLYGKSPEAITVPAGSCNVSIRSEKFTSPAFSKPVFGDDRCILVPPGEAVNAELNCRQINAGIRLDISPDFLEAHPAGVLFLKSSAGRLMYAYRENRYAHFLPDEVSLILQEEDTQKVVFKRKMKAGEMLHLNVSISSKSNVANSGLCLNIDTVRIWKTESCVIGAGGRKGDTRDNSLSVNQAKASVGMKDVWVSGYIVGGDMKTGATGISFNGPFNSDTHFAMGSRASVGGKESCISVQLPNGSIREQLNLVANPHLLGHRIYIKGDVEEKYFGVVGIKNVSDFAFQ